MKNFTYEEYNLVKDITPSEKRRIILVKNATNEEIWSTLVLQKITAIIKPKGKDYEISTLDGSVFIENNLNDFLSLVDSDIWFKSQIINKPSSAISEKDEWIMENYNRAFKKPYYFGTFAIRNKEGFITSIRGKQSKKIDYDDLKKMKIVLGSGSAVGLLPISKIDSTCFNTLEGFEVVKKYKQDILNKKELFDIIKNRK